MRKRVARSPGNAEAVGPKSERETERERVAKSRERLEEAERLVEAAVGDIAEELPAKRGPGKPKRVYTREEVREHILFVESLLLQPGLTEAQRASACQRRFGFARSRYYTLQSRIREVWAREDEHLIAVRKNEQTRRVMRHLQGAMGQKDANGDWVVRPNWAAVARFEDLLADLHGTREPIRIDIDARASEAVMMVVAQMTPEQVQARLDAYAQKMALAERVEREQVIDVPAMPAKH